MSRIEGVPEKRANPLVRILFALIRRETRRMTGRPGLMTGDMPIRAHRTSLLLGYCLLEKSVASRPRVEPNLRALAALKSAVMQGCEMCQDIGSQEARAAGVGDRQLRELYRYRDSELFDETECLVLDLAVAMTLTPVDVSDELFASLRARFDDAQIVELVNLIAVENLRSRFNATFAIGSCGFSEGMVCARMEPARTRAEAQPSRTGELAEA
jgi:AhpD family alkylhydroperoxidase